MNTTMTTSREENENISFSVNVTKENESSLLIDSLPISKSEQFPLIPTYRPRRMQIFYGENLTG